MKASIRTPLLAAIFALSATSHAELQSDLTGSVQLDPLQAHTVAMTDSTAVVYYVVMDNGDYQIVATVGPDTGVTGFASQHRITLSPGQSQVLELNSGSKAQTLHFSAGHSDLTVASR